MILDDLCDFLSSGGITASLYAGFAPDSNDPCVILYETGGSEPVRSFATGSGVVLERPRVQVVSRSNQYDYASSRTTIDAVCKLLEGMPARTINGVRYQWCGALQSPFPIGRDESGRVLLACNFEVIKELS